MDAKDLMKAILDLLTRAGKVPNNHTGGVELVLNTNQGGVRDARISVSESIK